MEGRDQSLFKAGFHANNAKILPQSLFYDVEGDHGGVNQSL